MVSSVRPVAQVPALPRPPQGHSFALMPWLPSPRRRAIPWIWQLTGGACDIGLTRPFPLDCYLPDLRCPTLRVPRCLRLVDPVTDCPAHLCPWQLIYSVD